jgi:hypothetical protein
MIKANVAIETYNWIDGLNKENFLPTLGHIMRAHRVTSCTRLTPSYWNKGDSPLLSIECHYNNHTDLYNNIPIIHTSKLTKDIKDYKATRVAVFVPAQPKARGTFKLCSYLSVPTTQYGMYKISIGKEPTRDIEEEILTGWINSTTDTALVKYRNYLNKKYDNLRRLQKQATKVLDDNKPHIFDYLKDKDAFSHFISLGYDEDEIYHHVCTLLYSRRGTILRVDNVFTLNNIKFAWASIVSNRFVDILYPEKPLTINGGFIVIIPNEVEEGDLITC